MIVIKKLTKRYGEKLLFRDFEYTFGDRGLWAITGDSGKGKTTLLRIIAGLDHDFEGSVDGAGIKATSVCFQEHRLFPTLTAIDNVVSLSFSINDSSAVKQARDLLFSLGFSEKDLLLYPHELSGGMRQRIALARAFLRPAPILILDEPTKELDPQLVDQVLEMIANEALKRTVIMVSHRENELDKLGVTKVPI